MSRLLVYSRTAGYRHASIPAGIAALRRLGEEVGFAVDATEDPAAFTDGGLSRYEVVVFLSTSGDVLGDTGRDALERYMAAGGAWLGVHGAATTKYDWPYFGGLAGTRFEQHPPEQTATVTVEDRGHPATAHTALGHSARCFTGPLFLRHLRGAVEWLTVPTLGPALFYSYRTSRPPSVPRLISPKSRQREPHSWLQPHIRAWRPRTRERVRNAS